MPGAYADLWWGDPTEVAVAVDDNRLDADEQRRAKLLRREADRMLFAAAHVTVREALSSMRSDIAPHEWEFVRSANGRPEIANTEVTLRFSLSHVRGSIACVVTDGSACGVDVEWLDRPLDTTLLARSALSVREADAFFTLPERTRHAEMLRLWTAKEAVLKATGTGLTMSPRDVDVEAGAVTMGGRRSTAWQLHAQREGRHVLTAAVISQFPVHWRRHRLGQTQPFCGSTT